MKARTFTFPFPSGGINARDPRENMPITDAISMRNIIPVGEYGELRKGSALVYGTIPGDGSPPASGGYDTLISFVLENGTERLIAFSAAGVMYEIDVGAGTRTSLKTGLTNGRWQHTVIDNTLILVNGEDQPQRLGSTTPVDATYTGIADDATLIDVTTYKGRLFFVQKDTASLWYGELGERVGALTEFDLGTIFRRGGSLFWVASMSASTGSGLQDYLVVCSTQGEMLLYAGDDPAVTWALVGRYYVGKPLSRRAKRNIASDLVFATMDGVFSLQSIVGGNLTGGKYTPMTDKIQPLYRFYADDRAVRFGWDLFYYPNKNLLFVAVPNRGQSFPIILVCNLANGAWCTVSGPQSYQFALFGERVIFAHPVFNLIFAYGEGTQDYLYSYFNGDYGWSPIEIALWTAYNTCGVPREKLFTMLKAGVVGPSDVQIFAEIGRDFQATPPNANPGTVTSVAVSTSRIANWQGVSGFCEFVSVYLAGSYNIAAPLRFSEMKLMFQPSAEVF